MGAAMKHLVPDRGKPSFVLLTLWRSVLSVRVPWCQNLQMNYNYKWRLTPVWHRMLC